MTKKTLFWGHFGQIWANMNFPGKIFQFCQFLNIPIIYHHAKKSEKANAPFLKKNAELEEGRTDGQTQRSGKFHGSLISRFSSKVAKSRNLIDAKFDTFKVVTNISSFMFYLEMVFISQRLFLNFHSNHT